MRLWGAKFIVASPRRKHSVAPCLRRNKLQEPSVTKLFLAFAVILAGLAGRSAVDKVLAQRGGAELVALWAQLSAVMESLAGVAAAGVGAGLAVLVSQTSAAERRQLFLQRALRLGLASTLPVGIVVALLGWRLTGGLLARETVALAALAGWVAVAHTVLNSYWLGQQRRGLMLALATLSAALALAAAVLAPAKHLLEFLVASQAAPALALAFVLRRSQAPQRTDDQALQRYILPGLAIGILSPVSMIVARNMVGDSLSWHESGVLQALWRVSDWICGFAGGILGLLYLPRLAAAHGTPEFRRVVREAFFAVLLPCAALFAVMFVLHRPLLEVLYDSSFRASALTVALVFAGNIVRIASWIALHALYAAVRTRAIAIGELLSLPLFAALLYAARGSLSLELAGALWLAAYLVYCAFNFWALLRMR